MDEARFVILRSVMNEQMFRRHFDILPVLTFLFHFKIISLSFYLWMRQKFMAGEESLGILLDLAKVCTWNDIIYALYTNNCANMAESLQRQQQQSEVCRRFMYPAQTVETLSKSVHHFYIRLKENLDSCAFENPKEFLSRLAARFTHAVRLLPEGSRRREHLLNKLMVIYCLQLQIYQTPSDRFYILKEMERTSSLSTSKAEWDALIMGKLAYTHALDGNITSAEEYSQGVNFVVATSSPCFMTYNIYYNVAMGKLAALEQTPSEETKTRMLFNASTALHSLADEDDLIREHWGRILLLAMCRCLLGVGTNYSTTGCVVTQQDRTQAKSRLAQFNQISDDMGARREMFYCFLMAKALSDDNVIDAIVYVRRALALSNEGAYRKIETQNIANLLEVLETNH